MDSGPAKPERPRRWPRPARPGWAGALAVFCAASAVFLLVRDVAVPEARDTEVWLGFEVHGWVARLTAPLHWAIFGFGAWGFWHVRPWVWPWSAVYAFGIAWSHLFWNLLSPTGGGWTDGLTQLLLFSVPAVALLWARFEYTGATAGEDRNGRSAESRRREVCL